MIAGDDPKAKAAVTGLLDEFGFDTVDAGPLEEGWRIQRDTPGYGPRRNAEECARTWRRPSDTPTGRTEGDECPVDFERLLQQAADGDVCEVWSMVE